MQFGTTSLTDKSGKGHASDHHNVYVYSFSLNAHNPAYNNGALSFGNVANPEMKLRGLIPTKLQSASATNWELLVLTRNRSLVKTYIRPNGTIGLERIQQS